MRKRHTMAAAALAATALLLAACGGDNGGSNSGSGSGGSGSSAGKVGVILPDTKSSARWETADAKYLKEAFDAAGVDSDIQNAQGDKTQFQTIGDQMITSGVNVLMIVNLDSGSGKAVLQKAQAAGIATIDYDRLTLGGGADFYVSFDNTKVGELQGEGLQKCLDRRRQDQGEHRVPQRLADGQQRDALQAGLRPGAQAATTAATTRSSPTRPSRLGQPAGRHDLRADVHGDRRQDRRRPRGQRRSRQRRDRHPQEERRERHRPGDRSGRDGPGPAEHPCGRPVHDRLQGRQEGGRRRCGAGHRGRQG